MKMMKEIDTKRELIKCEQPINILLYLTYVNKTVDVTPLRVRSACIFVAKIDHIE